MKRTFGSIRKERSGRFSVRYLGPDGRHYTARYPDGRSRAFGSRTEAERWLAGVQTDIDRDEWVSPDAEPEPEPEAPPLMGTYAWEWLDGRTDLRPSTRRTYASGVRAIVKAFGEQTADMLTERATERWWASMADRPTARGHAYLLLAMMLDPLAERGVIARNPCTRDRRRLLPRRRRPIKPATLAELEQIVAAVPARYRAMVLIAAWCSLRFGELAELRRGDVDLRAGVIRVERSVTRTRDGALHVGPPKSEAGVRDVAMPAFLAGVVGAHLAEHVGAGRDALLFPSARDDGRHLSQSTMFHWFGEARAAAGRPDLRFHDLRHTGATLAAATGATLAELKRRLGHGSDAAAMLYQHATDDRDAAIAAVLDKFHGGNVVPLVPRRGRRPRVARRRRAG